jgi:hypothetical protein
MVRHFARAALALATVACVVAGEAVRATSAGAVVPHGVAGDFDGDGRADLAIGAPLANRVQVRYTYARPHGSPVQVFGGDGNFGQTLAIGDFSGDGIADLAVGAPNVIHPADPDVGSGVPETMGAISVFLGSHTGLHAEAVSIHGRYDGDEPFTLGTAIAAGDVDGDGFADLAVSIPEEDLDSVRIYSGGPHGLIASSFTTLDAQGPTALLLADLNGDHHPELVAGPAFLNGDGILIFHGAAHGIRATLPEQITDHQVGVFQLFGESMAAGDVNGDGFTDLVVGAPRDNFVPQHPSPGSIVLLTGGPGGVSAARHQTTTERTFDSHWRNGDHFGTALAVARVTGDRFADVIVGAPREHVAGNAGAGAVYLLRGSAHGIASQNAQRFTLSSPNVPGAASKDAAFGSAVFAARLTGDGHVDVAIGAPGSNFAAHRGGLVVRLAGTADGLTTHAARALVDHMPDSEFGACIR